MSLSRRGFIAGTVATAVAVATPLAAAPVVPASVPEFESLFSKVFKLKDIPNPNRFEAPTDEDWVRIETIGHTEQEALEAWYREALNYADGRGDTLYWRQEPTAFRAKKFNSPAWDARGENPHSDYGVADTEIWTVTAGLLVSDEPWADAGKTVMLARSKYDVMGETSHSGIVGMGTLSAVFDLSCAERFGLTS